jgi:hypothetical protein
MLGLSSSLTRTASLATKVTTWFVRCPGSHRAVYGTAAAAAAIGGYVATPGCRQVVDGRVYTQC